MYSKYTLDRDYVIMSLSNYFTANESTYLKIPNFIAVKKNYIAKGGEILEIILSNSSSKPIYEQITTQIKGMIMSNELKTGDALPSMRSLAKSLHISVITAQHAYEDLQRDGFIETIAGKGTFVAAQNKDFIREEELRNAEEKLKEAADIAKRNGIALSQLVHILTILYKEV